MKNSSQRFPVVVFVLIGTLILTLSGGCEAKPEVVCVMENPTTEQRVKMFKESRFKVPADYDEKKHIEQWRAEQRKMGYTVEVPN
jgi:hypothetical protein